MLSKYWLILFLALVPLLGVTAGFTLYHFFMEGDPLEGCRFVFVLGDKESHVDQEGDWLILVEPKKFECHDDWDHEAYGRRGAKYVPGNII